jgi:hypothetical protein
MMIMRRFIFLSSLLTLLIAAGGCNSRQIPGPPDSTALPFALRLPTSIPAGEYHAVSGTLFQTELVPAGRDSVTGRDSVMPVVSRSYYAQFTTSPGVTPPTKVTLNGLPMERHHDTDTLRLGEGNVASGIFGRNTWVLHGAADSAAFMTEELTPVDSVMPFVNGSQIRGDVDLQIRWPAPKSSSGGVIIYWTIPDLPEYVITANDIGVYTMRRQDLEKFRNATSVSIVRFRNETRTYDGRRLIVTRLAQHNYAVEVLL